MKLVGARSKAASLMRIWKKVLMPGLSWVLATGLLATDEPPTRVTSRMPGVSNGEPGVSNGLPGGSNEVPGSPGMTTTPALTVPLELRVIDEDGRPLGGVWVTIESEEPPRTLRGTLLGEHLFELREGSHQLRLSHPSTYDVVLSGFEINPPQDPKRLKSVLEPLRIMMQRRRDIEEDGPSQAKRKLGVPNLAITFSPEGRLVSQRPAIGVITLRNTGSGSIQMPYERTSMWTPDSLTSRLTVQIEGTDLLFDEFFLCLPSDSCLELAPGQEIEWPVSLNDAQSYSTGKSEPAIWPRAGFFGGKVGVELILPQRSAETPSTTHPVEASFTVEVLPK